MLLFTIVIFLFALFYSLNRAEFTGISTFWDGLYLSLVTITTLGFGDITPTTSISKIVTAVEPIFGLIFVGMFLNSMGLEQSHRKEKEISRRNKDMNIELAEHYYDVMRNQLLNICLDCLFDKSLNKFGVEEKRIQLYKKIDQLQFKDYFIGETDNINFLKSKWNNVVFRGLSRQETYERALRQLLRFSSHLSFFLLNVQAENNQSLNVLRTLSVDIDSIDQTEMDVVHLSNLMLRIMAGKDVITGYSREDLIANAISTI